MLRISQSLLFATLVLGTALLAQAQVTLNHSVTPNSTWIVENVVSAEQTLTLAGMDIDTESNQTVKVKREAGPRSDDGQVTVKQSFENLKADLSLPGGVEINFDSSNPDEARQGTQFDVLVDIFTAMSKSSWSIVYGKDGRVVGVQGQEQVLEGLDDNVKELLKRQMEEEYLKEQANNEIQRLPDTPVSKGDSWERSSDVRLEAGQHLSFVTKYTYEGTVEKDGRTLDKITSKGTEVAYSIDQDAPTPLRVAGSDLSVDESTGTLFFDRELGQIVERHDRSRITGEINFSVNGMELPGKLDLVMENTYTAKKQ